jgi:hypothetical protein
MGVLFIGLEATPRQVRQGGLCPVTSVHVAYITTSNNALFQRWYQDEDIWKTTLLTAPLIYVTPLATNNATTQ